MFKNRILSVIFPLAALILLVLALFSASGLSLEEDVMALLPDKKGSHSEYKELLANFNPLNTVFISISAKKGANIDQETLDKAADFFYLRLSNSGFFQRIMYRWTYDDLEGALKLLKKYRSSFFTEQAAHDFHESINEKAIIKKLENWLDLLQHSPDPFTSRQMIADPLSFDNFFLSLIGSLHKDDEKAKITVHNSRLSSGDHQKRLMIAKPFVRGMDSGRSKELVYLLNSLVFLSKGTFPGIQVNLLSGHRYSMENSRRIQADISLTVSIAIIAIVLLALLVYSRPLLALLTIIPAFFGTALALGSLARINPKISAIIIGTGALLIGIAVDYGIHFLFHYDRACLQKEEADSIPALLRKLFKPLLFSMLTTIAAFLCLQFSVLPSYRDLGIYVSCGIAAAMFCVLFVLPYLLPSPLKQGKGKIRLAFKKPVLEVEKYLARLFPLIAKKRKWVLIGLIIITAALAPGLYFLKFDGNLSNLNAETKDMLHDKQMVLSAFGSAASATLAAVKAPTAELALAENVKVKAALARLKKEGLIDSYSSNAAFLPSFEMQKENRKRWKKFQQEELPLLKENFKTACTKTGFNVETFSGFFRSLEKKIPQNLIEPAVYENCLINDILSPQIARSEKEIFILSTLLFYERANLPRIRAELEKASDKLLLYDGRSHAEEIIQLIFGEMRRLGLIALGIIFIVLLILKRNLFSALAMLLPLLISLIWTFGIMGWFDIKVNIINSIISVFVLGLVIDYSIFLKTASEKSESLSSPFLAVSSGSVLLSALTTLFGLGVLVLASHPALFSLGISSFLSILNGLLAVFIILPLMYKKQKKEKT